MSVLVKGMKKPKSCEEWTEYGVSCPFLTTIWGDRSTSYSDYHFACIANNWEPRKVRNTMSRPKWCPMKEVKE